jgi:hypothetical protein
MGRDIKDLSISLESHDLGILVSEMTKEGTVAFSIFARPIRDSLTVVTDKEPESNLRFRHLPNSKAKYLSIRLLSCINEKCENYKMLEVQKLQVVEKHASTRLIPIRLQQGISPWKDEIRRRLHR